MIKPGKFSQVVYADNRRDEFDVQNETLALSGASVKCVFLGDSITQNFEPGAFFSGANGAFINRGIGGDVPKYMLKRFDADVAQLKPDWVVVLAGINDIWVLDDAAEDGERSYDSLLDYISNGVLALAERAKEAGIKCAVCGLLPTNIPPWIPGGLNNEKRNLLICDINSRLKANLGDFDAVYVDLSAEIILEDGVTLNRGYSLDGIHPNGSAYQLMADALKRAVPQLAE